MLEDTGIEPMTSRMQSERSTNWAKPPDDYKIKHEEVLCDVIAIFKKFIRVKIIIDPRIKSKIGKVTGV